MVDSPGGTATRFRLQLSYDGSEFHGWAKQRGLRTVEGELGSVVDHLVAAHVDLTCAGRTDAGVHARGQVVHFDAERVDRLTLDHLNGALPHDIRVRQFGCCSTRVRCTILRPMAPLFVLGFRRSAGTRPSRASIPTGAVG